MAEFLQNFVNIGGKVAHTHGGIQVYKADSSLDQALEQRTLLQSKNRASQQIADTGCGSSGSCMPCGSTYMLPGVVSAELPISTGIFDLISGTGYARSVQQWFSDDFYLAPRNLCCTDDIPTLDAASYCCETTSLTTLVLAYKSCVMDWTQYCGPNGYQLWHPEADLQRKVMEALAYASNELAFKGNSEEDIIGLANNHRLPSVPMPNFFDSTPEQILGALSQALTQIRVRQQFAMSASGGYEKQKLILALPSMYYDLLDAMILPGTSVSLLQHLMNRGCGLCGDDNTAPTYKLTIVPIPELNQMGPNNEPMGFLFPLGSLRWVRPYFTSDGIPSESGSPYVVLEPYRDGLHNIQIVWCKVGSVYPTDYTKVIKLRF